MAEELIYLFTGTSEIFIKNRIDRIIQSYSKYKIAISKYDMETTSLSHILSDAITIPLLEDYKIIILRHPKFLSTNKLENTPEVKAFIKYLKNPVETTILMIDATNINIQNNDIYKALKNFAMIINYSDSEEIEVRGWVVRTLATHNIEIKDDALVLFMEYLNDGMNQKTFKELFETKSFNDSSKDFRNVKFSDIAILSRGNEFLKEISKVLSEYKVPISVSKSDNIYKDKDVVLLLSLLKIVNNMHDDIALSIVLNSFIFNFSFDELNEIRAFSEHEYFYQCFEDYAISGKDEKLRTKIASFDLTDEYQVFAYSSLYLEHNHMGQQNS